MGVFSLFSVPDLLFYLTAAIITVWLVLYINIHRVSAKWCTGQARRDCGFPFIGLLLIYAFKNQEELYHRVRCGEPTKHPKVHVDILEIAMHKFAGVSSPEGVEAVLSSKDHIAKANGYDLISCWLGNGLLLSSGTKWFNRRKMLTSAFHFQILEEFMKVFNDQSQMLASLINNETDVFDIVSRVIPCTLDIICEAAMGVKLETQANKDSEYFRAINRVSEIFTYRQVHPWLHPDFIFSLTNIGRENKQCVATLHGFTDKVINARKEELRQQNKRKTIAVKSDEKGKRLAFLDLLLKCAEEDHTFTDRDIREEVDTFMFEGHDTTAMAISWCLFLLGTRPDHQVRVHEELDSIFGDSDRPATMADLTQMTYLDMCIKETLRLYPSVPIIGRQLENDFEIMGTTLPKGTNLVIAPINIHRLPENFPNPEVFNPDHFLPDRVAQRHPFAYIPFSAGPRNCIGQRFAMLEQKVVIATILRRFKVTAMERREDVTMITDIILRPKYGLRILVDSRKKQ